MEFVGVPGFSMLELYGFTPEEMIGMDVRAITVDPSERDQVQSAIEAAGG